MGAECMRLLYQEINYFFYFDLEIYPVQKKLSYIEILPYQGF